MDSVQIGKYLSAMRKYYKITQDELANKLNVTRQAISKWETGVTMPDIELLMKLSEIYGVSINDILKADVTSIKFQKEIVFPSDDKKPKNVMVIGCGRWGTFISWYLDKIGHRVTLYGRENSVKMQRLQETRRNEYLQLNESINLVTNLEKANDADYIIISIASQSLQGLIDELANYSLENKIVILCMKGIEISTGRRLSQIVSDGLDLSSLKGALMSRGTSEIAKLIAAMGGNASTVYGLCHLGDYEATLFSEHSHNLTFGKNVVLKKDYDKLAEGYYTVKALRNLGKSYGVELPICEAVYQILYEDAEPKKILKKLFSRSLRNEFV